MFHTVFPIGFSYFSACLPPSNLLLNNKTFCFDTASEAQVALAQDEKGAAAELHLAQLHAIAGRIVILVRVQCGTRMYYHHHMVIEPTNYGNMMGPQSLVLFQVSHDMLKLIQIQHRVQCWCNHLQPRATIIKLDDLPTTYRISIC